MSATQNPTLRLSRDELETILVWYETLRDEGGNEPEDDVLYEKLADAFDGM